MLKHSTNKHGRTDYCKDNLTNSNHATRVSEHDAVLTVATEITIAMLMILITTISITETAMIRVMAVMRMMTVLTTAENDTDDSDHDFQRRIGKGMMGVIVTIRVQVSAPIPKRVP